MCNAHLGKWHEFCSVHSLSYSYMDISKKRNRKYKLMRHTSKFEEEARPPVPSGPNIIKLFGTTVFIPSPGVWGVWVDAGELGEGPAVFPVPVLLAGPEDECCFLFLLFCRVTKGSISIICNWKSSRTSLIAWGYSKKNIFFLIRNENFILKKKNYKDKSIKYPPTKKQI